ncbi:hypothetical protein TWF225_012097 [Orbilia oligospora]|uniref:Uncharacterized protein n=1 Tax=Orbilia oligospora TaxID=2813651 RepID=A0A7C8JVX0_ORBOL|nr:hypothetical protein TWF751_012119 [Orbilia oligospora]KAF3194497.1 hypothetical protein TWF225_012097 [Orbilia oligospora]KAF3260663.1 hypothetical protein TWF128_012082 [Orbilia oligospora]KAF3272614.1 hypothetical protein TWF217_012065 [Orbilia oligospora]KAF3293098.1 hypothetical protein TWF132_012097 [Orbilia oligospora]
MLGCPGILHVAGERESRKVGKLPNFDVQIPSIFNLGSCFRTVQHTNDHSFGARIYITLIMKIEIVAAFEALRRNMEIFFHVIILSFISISKKCDAVCIYVY